MKKHYNKKNSRTDLKRNYLIKLKSNQSVRGYLFLLPSLCGVIIFSVIPFIDAVLRSFKEAMSGKFSGFSNYRTVIENKAFQLAAGNTAKFILICIPLLLVVSLLLSAVMMNIKKHGEFFKTTYLIPMAVPVASMVVLWKVFFHDNGLINSFMISAGINPVGWFDTDHAFFLLVFTYVWKNCGYDMVLWLAGLNNIPKSIYEAASIDGCSRFQKMIYITIPNLKITIFTVTSLSLINSFKVFREAYLLCGDYPHDSIYMLQHLFNNWFVTLDVQKMCAAAVLMAAVIFSLLLILQKVLNTDS